MDTTGMISMTARSDEEILARAPLHVILGGRDYALHPRVIATARAWQDTVRSAFVAGFGAIDKVDGIGGILLGSPEALIDYVREYDEAGVLPDRDWLVGNATADEAKRAFLVIFEHEFPFFDLGHRLAPSEAMDRITPDLVALILSTAPGSTNSRCTNGGSGRRRNSRHH